MRLGILYGGVALAFLAHLWRGSSPKLFRAAIRSALFIVATSWIASGISDDGFVWGLAAASWFTALALTMPPMGRRRLVLMAAAGMPFVLIDGWLPIIWGLGAMLCHDMLEQRHAAWRTALHGASFMGAAAYAAPTAIVRLLPLSGERATLGVISGVVLAVGSLVLGVRASMEFVRTGGTPEPWDPPTRLVTSGPFRIIRHPLQLAECGLVWAAALMTCHVVVAIYALVFSVLMLVPMRVQEEQALVQRFGDEARRWLREVPTYVPRVRLGRSLVSAPDTGRASFRLNDEDGF